MKSNKSVKSFLCSFLKTFFLYLIRQNTEGLHSELPVRNFKMKQKTSLCFRKFSKQKKKTFLSTQEYIRAQYKSSHLEARRHFRLYSACNIHDYFCSDSSFGAKCQLPQTSASVVTSVLGAASILLKKANLKTNLPNHFHKIMFFLTVSFSFKSILISIIVFFNTG